MGLAALTAYLLDTGAAGDTGHVIILVLLIILIVVILGAPYIRRP